MRIAVLGHSLVAERQSRYLAYVRSHGVDVLEVYPSEWGRERREGGHRVHGDMSSFLWPSEAVEAVRAFDPDWVYIMQEWWSLSASQLDAVAHANGSRVALFAWENIRRIASQPERRLVRDVDLFVAGNPEALAIAREAGYRGPELVQPQVGVDFSLFRPMPEVQRTHDVVFLGRPVPEKGVHTLRATLAGTGITCLYAQEELGWTPWASTPGRYALGRAHVSVPIDTPAWKEQWASYCHVEALACGLPTVASAAPAVAHYLRGAPGVVLVPPKDPAALRTAIRMALEARVPDLFPYEIGEVGPREWAESLWGYDAHWQQLELALRAAEEKD